MPDATDLQRHTKPLSWWQQPGYLSAAAVLSGFVVGWLQMLLLTHATLVLVASPSS